MTDIKPTVAERLKSLADVELSYTKSGRKLPVICISETGNSAEIVLNGEDRVSRLTLQLDIYAGSAEEAEGLAASVSGELTSLGMRRGFSQLMTDEEIPRRCMRFTCGIDELSGRILRL